MLMCFTQITVELLIICTNKHVYGNFTCKQKYLKRIIRNLFVYNFTQAISGIGINSNKWVSGDPF